MLISCSVEKEKPNEENDTFLQSKFTTPSFSSEILTNTTNTFEVRVNASDTLIYYKSDVVSVGNVMSEVVISIESDALYKMNYEVEVVDHFRLIQHENIITNSEEEISTNNLEFEDYKNLSATFQNVGQFITNEIIETGGNSEHIHSLSFQESIINTVKRGKNNNNSCACSPTPEYVLNKSMFACQEDVKYPVSLVKELFNQHPELLETDDHASEALYSHVIETSATEMSYIDIYSFYYSNADYLLTLERIHSNSTVEGGCGW